MTQEEKKSPTWAGGAGAGGPDAAGIVHPDYTPTSPTSQELDRHQLAAYNLARLLAGASDADLGVICAIWPDFPGDGRSDLALIRAWVNQRPDVADAVLRICPDGPPPSATRKTSWTAAELLATDFPEPRWVVPGLIPEGLTFLAGRPKVGKSWLALQAACAVACGGRMFDQPVPPGNVLYLALEDSPRRIRGRIVKQQWPASERVRFEFEWPDLARDKGLAALYETVTRNRYNLVVLDTLSRAATYDQSDVTIATVVVGNLQRFATDCQIAILAVDHYRKPGGAIPDVVDDLLGSTGKAATADTIIGLYREQGKRGARLSLRGRDIEERTLALYWDGLTCTWQALGEAGDVAQQESRQRVLQALADLGGEATTSEIADHLSDNKGNVSRALADLCNAGLVLRGRREGHKQYYRLARTDDDGI